MTKNYKLNRAAKPLAEALEAEPTMSEEDFASRLDESGLGDFRVILADVRATLKAGLGPMLLPERLPVIRRWIDKPVVPWQRARDPEPFEIAEIPDLETRAAVLYFSQLKATDAFTAELIASVADASIMGLLVQANLNPVPPEPVKIKKRRRRPLPKINYFAEHNLFSDDHDDEGETK
jgi:hypothetical protein